MERRRFPAILLLLVAVPAFCLASEPAPFSLSDGWTLSSESSGITLYNRPHPGSSLKEFKAVGEIDAPAHAVHNVIDDVEAYPSFMPFTAECRLIKREADSIITYQRPISASHQRFAATAITLFVFARLRRPGRTDSFISIDGNWRMSSVPQKRKASSA